MKSITLSLFSCIFVLVLSTLSYGDDTSIFGGNAVNVKPNVLIVFDTSGSMDMEPKVPGTAYVPATDYTNYSGVSIKFTKNTIYRLKHGGNSSNYSHWIVYSTTPVSCAQAQNDLNTKGYWQGNIRDNGTHNCGGNNYRRLRMGNYLNFLQSDAYSAPRWKIDVAVEAVKQVVATTSSTTRLGLMRFNGSTGGTVVVPVADNNATAITNKLDTDSLFSDPVGGTPLGETLAEAGLYFAGKKSWAHPTSTSTGIISSGTYISPIQWRCQKNHIIIVTDGGSQVDTGLDMGGSLFAGTYMNGLAIGDYDNDGRDPGTSRYENNGTDYLDDVAKFLNAQDMRVGGNDASGTVSFDADDFEIQNIQVHTISFAIANDTYGLYAKQLLQDTATNGKGIYATAEDLNALVDALLTIIGDINITNTNFVAPVVPVSKMNRLYSGNSIYLGLFRPDDSGIWKGNLKKFGLNVSGELLQKGTTDTRDSSTHVAATDTYGYILDTSISCWSSSADGPEVNQGGIGAVLNAQAGRIFYTYKPGNTAYALSNSNNLFNKDNSFLTSTLLDVPSGADDDLIDYVRSEGSYVDRDWVLGDILHSRPTILYDGNKSVLFVGANDGFLHCFEDDDNGTPYNLSDDTVEGKWSFVPWDLLPSLKQTHPTYTDSVHDYFVDGSPVLYTSDADKYVTFGLRRGGTKYYTLDVGDVNAQGVYATGGYTSPSFAWQIGGTTETSLGENLGQSWGKPQVCKFKTGSGASSYVKALAFTGGYDTNQDADAPAATDTRGRAIFAIDPDVLSTSTPSGNPPEPSLLGSLLKFTYASNTSNLMTHSIVDMMIFDRNGDNFEDTIYAGDMGGKLFAAKADTTNGVWSDANVLFQSRHGATASSQLKFFNAPDAVGEAWGHYVYIGTGDREHPHNDVTVDRFYAIKNRWPSSWVTMNESTSNFIDVTDYSVYADGTHSPGWLKSDVCNGWYFRLGYGKGSTETFGHVRPGEKVVSSPVVFYGVVYFSTFVPDPDTSGTDYCEVSKLGQGRLYAVDYRTGEAVYNFYEGNDNVSTGVAVLDDRDRSLTLGPGIPTQPTMIVTSKGPILLIGSAGGVKKLKAKWNPNDNRYLWKQN